VNPPKVQGLACANGQIDSGSLADVPADGIGDSGGTYPIKPRSLTMQTPRSHVSHEIPRSRSALDELRMPVRAKLAAAWTSFMFLYIYVDYLALYKPGFVDEIRAGIVHEFDTGPTFVALALTLMAIPILMILLSTTLPARATRSVNLVVATLYIPVSIYNVAGEESWAYSYFYGFSIGLEVVLLAFILRSAWTWPRRTASSPATPAAGLDTTPLRTPQQA
jgi:hypothetical protein